MPPARKNPPTPPRRWSSEEVNATIARVTPDLLALLADGVPRSKAAIVTALAEHHARDDIKRAIMRLAVLGRLVEQGGRYRLAPDEPEDDQG